MRLRGCPAQVKSGELVTLVELPNGTSGALFNVKFDAQSTNYGYLEVCAFPRLLSAVPRPPSAVCAWALKPHRGLPRS